MKTFGDTIFFLNVQKELSSHILFQNTYFHFQFSHNNSFAIHNSDEICLFYEQPVAWKQHR